MWVVHVYHFRMAYGFFSLGYGRDTHPLGLLGISELPYHRRRVVPGCCSTFLLDMWFKVNLVDPCENADQRFGFILPGGHRIALRDGYAHHNIHSLRVSTPWVSHPQNAH